jgi:hypothetical protein
MKQLAPTTQWVTIGSQLINLANVNRIYTDGNIVLEMSDGALITFPTACSDYAHAKRFCDELSRQSATFWQPGNED